MGIHNKSNVLNNKIISSRGNVLEEDVISPNSEENKFYASVVMCGYAGVGYYIPILFPVYAKDIKSAEKILLTYSRVKSNVSGCILAIKEVSKIEADFIKYINLYDTYLAYSNSEEMIKRRRVMMPYFVKILKDKEEGRHLSGQEKERLERSQIKDIHDLKFADEYESYYVLQKYFAPKYEKGEIVFPKYVNMDCLLKDYFESRTENLGMGNEDLRILLYYLKLFGDDNELGISLDKENKIVKFIAPDREKKEVKIIDKKLIKFLEVEQENRLKNALEKTKKEQEIPSKSYKVLSAIEKFNKRMEKTEKFRNKEK